MGQTSPDYCVIQVAGQTGANGSGRHRLCENRLTKQRASVKQTGQVWLVAGQPRGLSDNNGRPPH